MNIKPIHAIIVIILAIGIFASFSGIIPEPTGALTSGVFKVDLIVYDDISNRNYEVIADTNTTALDVLENSPVEAIETNGQGEVTAIYTTGWIMDNNQSHWVFKVNGKKPTRNGVEIKESRYYVSPNEVINFSYVPRNT